MSDLELLAVQILGREYKLRCRPEEHEPLTLAAQRLDAEMRAIRATGKALSTERVAIMAALNIAHELLQMQASLTELQVRLSEKIHNLQVSVDNFLGTEETI
ncbi:MAG: cell division protein ZapA [Methylohalobius sp.]|nr:cell division protein ZapA [Methylohalobius sp.]